MKEKKIICLNVTIYVYIKKQGSKVSLGLSCCCPGASCETLRTNAEPVIWSGGTPGEKQALSFSNTSAAPFPPVSQAKPMVPTIPEICPSCSSQLLATYGFLEAWLAALGLKHSPVFGTRDVLCCCHGLCSCHGLARSQTEDKLLREGRVSKGTSCTSCIKVQAWVEELHGERGFWVTRCSVCCQCHPTYQSSGWPLQQVCYGPGLAPELELSPQSRGQGQWLTPCSTTFLWWPPHRNLGRLPASKGCPAFWFWSVLFFPPLCYDSGGKDWSFQRITHIMQ